MYSVFLVEDEIVIRDGLKVSFPWEQYGFAYVGDAADGEVALPLIRQTKLIISNMKHMINLARVFKKETSNNVKSNYNNNINVNNNVSYIEKKAIDNNPNFFI